MLNYAGTIIVLWVLAAHWFADFVMQTHWQASNKSKNWVALTLHVTTYSTVMSALLAVLFPPPALVLSYVGFFVITFVAHFITDGITSRVTSWLFMDQFEQKFAGDIKTGFSPCLAMKRDFNPHWFFVVVGFDQLLHYVQLFITLSFLTERQ